jgi:hypothetical protein
MLEEEESREITPLRAWIFVVVLSALLVGWGLFNFKMIPERQREFDYGVLPDTPAQSEYSTGRPPAPAVAPEQILHLPGATSLPASGPAEGQP